MAKRRAPKSAFKKGDPRIHRGGKKPGTQNTLTRELKEAIVLAAEKVGQDGKGKDGAVGYLAWLAKKRPEVFGQLLGKLLPYQISGAGGGPVKFEYKDPATIAEAFKQRGLPLPVGLFKSINHELPKVIDVTPAKKDEAA